MKTRASFVLLVALFALADASVRYMITTSWNGGLSGTFFVKPNQETNGWEFSVSFDKQATMEIWDAVIRDSAKATTFTLRNQAYNPKLSAAAETAIGFVLRYTGDAVPIFIINQGTFGGSATTSAPATTRPVSSTTAPATTTKAATTTGVPTTTTRAASTTATTTTTTRPATTTGATTAASSAAPGTCNTNSKYPYTTVIQKSILFYEAQRSGSLPASTKQRVPWRSDSALNDGKDKGLDLTGGWYDAGDFVKFNFPMAHSAVVLGWGILEFRDTYASCGLLNDALDEVRWATDYLLKCWRGNELYVQVGDGHIDHNYWGRPEQMTMSRPSFSVTPAKPGSDVAGDTSSALAIASILFKTTDPAYSTTLLKAAKETFQFGNQYRRRYSDSVSAAAAFYRSSSYFDELAQAAAFLYIATGNTTYLNAAKQLYIDGGLGSTQWAYSWDDKGAAVQVLLYKLTNETGYMNAVTSFMTSWMPGGSVPYTPKGLAYRDQWGALHYAANTALLGLVVAKYGVQQTAYVNWARTQIHYMLGDTGRSFVVGFGVNPPNAPHHASSSCAPCNWTQPSTCPTCDWPQLDAPGPNPSILYGALVGGPDQSDNFVNDRTNYILNEVTTDYNAGFQSALAGLQYFVGKV